MPGYDTSPSGLDKARQKDDMVIQDAKSGSPKGASGTYQDVPNQAQPDESTIGNNFVNSHMNSAGMSGSTADFNREKP